MAHYQIWHDFVIQREKEKGLVDAEKDIMIIFEDDAVIAVNNVTWALQVEISEMNEDLLYLGWCYGKKENMPMCTHAYAVTRAGARKMINNWDVCSLASVDGQWHQLHKKGLITWKKAAQSSWDDLKHGLEVLKENNDYFTRGIFIQKSGYISFNHHGYQNNAGFIGRRNRRRERR